MNRNRGLAIVAFFLLGALQLSLGQPTEETASLPLLGVQTRAAAVPPQVAATLIDITIDDPAGFFDVVATDPAVVVSLVLPSGVEVTAGNADGLGFRFITYTIDTGSSFVVSPMTGAGTHTMMDTRCRWRGAMAVTGYPFTFFGCL